MDSKPWLASAPTYRRLEAYWDTDDDAPGPRCSHTLTAVTATSELSNLNISEDPVVYSPKKIKNFLQRIDVSGVAFISERVFVVLGQVVDPLYLPRPVGCSLYQMGRTLFHG